MSLGTSALEDTGWVLDWGPPMNYFCFRIALYSIREVSYMRILLFQFQSNWSLLEENAEGGRYSIRWVERFFLEIFYFFFSQGSRSSAWP